MFFEDVAVTNGQTAEKLVSAYGHSERKARSIWALPENRALARGDLTTLKPGDIFNVPIPWRLTVKVFRVESRGVSFELARDGGRGSRLSWVQTVYRHNQPIGPNPRAFCVDACTPDDDLPFYWTDAEVASEPNLRRWFMDSPSRNPPSAAAGPTRWRAVVSAATVTGKRVTVFGSTTWGFNMDPSGAVRHIGPRAAVGEELTGHLHLLANGVGTRGISFSRQGWSFRAAQA